MIVCNVRHSSVTESVVLSPWLEQYDVGISLIAARQEKRAASVREV